ncbi:unnamed protein product [Rhodiola kirilowii]
MTSQKPTTSYTEQDLKLFSSISHNRINSRYSKTSTIHPLLSPTFTTSTVVRRMVTNIGSTGTYEAKVIAADRVFITVVPSKLKFSDGVCEEKMFEVSFKVTSAKKEELTYVFGSLVWTNCIHNVRSPIIVQRV